MSTGTTLPEEAGRGGKAFAESVVECVAAMRAGGVEVLHEGVGDVAAALLTRQASIDVRYPPLAAHRLQLCLNGRLRGTQETAGLETAAAYRAGPGSLHFVPAGQAARVLDEGRGSCLHLLIAREPMDEVFARLPPVAASETAEPMAFNAVLDESIHGCLLPLHRALLIPGRALAPRLDALAKAVCAGILERDGEGGLRPGKKGERLSPARLALALDALEREVIGNGGLAAVAHAVGLSRHHFSRAFRNTAGLSPYRHVTRRRIARAKAMLESGELSLAAVARACGYSSQTHMTSAFRRHVGTTPARYRAAHRR